MKKIVYIVVFVFLLINHANAQTLPIAVNDTFYCHFDTPLTVIRNNIISNDSDPNSNFLIIDTLIYSGAAQVVSTYQTGLASWIKLNKFVYTPPSGFFGLDTLKYTLANNVNPNNFDTATIYVYVMRKSFENLDINNIDAIVHKNRLFGRPPYYGLTPLPGFTVPKSSNLNTIYSVNPWIVGKNSNNELVSNIKTYASFDNKQGNAGPIMDPAYYEYYSYQWDRVWKITQTEIDDHIANYMNPGYQAIEVIANWPAHGDVSKGQAANLASFVDVDNDGIYNPLNGDYPLIKGNQAIFFMVNNERDSTFYSEKTLRSEIHGLVYSYGCINDSALNNTVFVNYKIYNRSNDDISEVYMGEWVDFDIGNMYDDYFGCDVSRSAFFSYNSDTFDEANAAVPGYGSNPPVQGIMILKGPKKDDDGIDNPLTINIQNAIDSGGVPYPALCTGCGDGIVDNEYFGMEHFITYAYNDTISVSGEPLSIYDYYGYLQGKWRNNTSITWGGNGVSFSNGSTLTSKYIYPMDTDSLNWSTGGVVASPNLWEETSLIPEDRRGVGASGPFTLPVNGMVEMDLAFVFARDYQDPGNKAGIPIMQERMDSIRKYFFNNELLQNSCLDFIEPKDSLIIIPDSIVIFTPNVFTPNKDGINDQFVIQFYGTNLIETLNVKVYNRWGEMLKESKFNIEDVHTVNYQSQITIWDGTTSTGQNVPVGTYYYIISYQTKEGNKESYKSFLTLLR
ncbi:MAG: gliding motility-associated C-terminal domain-containing protein [Flavobacteriales bacterium]|nr:gliding motility-associated C-terminal domain-containing protein [Flavobacteriales bacterium]MCB9335696.1 gliding motility-associated C-terminal domain-containing protein [Flavobacteriales bacterium]